MEERDNPGSGDNPEREEERDNPGSGDNHETREADSKMEGGSQLRNMELELFRKFKTPRAWEATPRGPWGMAWKPPNGG